MLRRDTNGAIEVAVEFADERFRLIDAVKVADLHAPLGVSRTSMVCVSSNHFHVEASEFRCVLEVLSVLPQQFFGATCVLASDIPRVEEGNVHFIGR